MRDWASIHGRLLIVFDCVLSLYVVTMSSECHARYSVQVWRGLRSSSRSSYCSGTDVCVFRRISNVSRAGAPRPWRQCECRRSLTKRTADFEVTYYKKHRKVLHINDATQRSHSSTSQRVFRQIRTRPVLYRYQTFPKDYQCSPMLKQKSA